MMVSGFGQPLHWPIKLFFLLIFILFFLFNFFFLFIIFKSYFQSNSFCGTREEARTGEEGGVEQAAPKNCVA